MAFLAMLASLCRGRRSGKVIGRVAVKKAVWLEKEAYVGGWHDRIVFGPRDVGMTEGVPKHDILVGDGTVLLRPAFQAVAPRGLVRKVAGGVFFILGERRDPDVMVDKASPFSPPGFFGGKRHGVVPRK